MKQKNIEKAYEIISSRIPNLKYWFNKTETKKLIKQIPDDKLETADDEFMKLDEVWNYELRRCDICGNLFNAGYYIRGSYYACSDKCRHEMYKSLFGSKDDEQAEIDYLRDCYEIDDYECQGMSALEIMNAYAECDVSDETMYTEW